MFRDEGSSSSYIFIIFIEFLDLCGGFVSWVILVLFVYFSFVWGFFFFQQFLVSQELRFLFVKEGIEVQRSQRCVRFLGRIQMKLFWFQIDFEVLWGVFRQQEVVLDVFFLGQYNFWVMCSFFIVFWIFSIFLKIVGKYKGRVQYGFFSLFQGIFVLFGYCYIGFLFSQYFLVQFFFLGKCFGQLV